MAADMDGLQVVAQFTAAVAVVVLEAQVNQLLAAMKWAAAALVLQVKLAELLQDMQAAVEPEPINREALVILV
jgi:steroid 5-alpha reductase family enzyme